MGRRGGIFHWKVILCEGKNHEVKRIFKNLASKIIQLHRASFAGVTVDNLCPGKYRELKKKEIDELLRPNELIEKN